jgi:hypothetical protein
LALTQTRRLFNRSATLRNSDVMKLLNLLRRLTFETDRAAIGGRCRIAVDSFADTKRTPIMAVEQARLSRTILIPHRLSSAKNTEDGVIEPF